MIFKPEMVEKILSGEKTVTRRPLKQLDRYQPGRDYAVQPGRGKHAVARIRVTFVHEDRLGSITEDDARREGFLSSEAFFDYWDRLYGFVDYDQAVTRIAFRLLPREGEDG